jgi:predicted RNase H-related nuclease YkuK (DUF458 family)
MPQFKTIDEMTEAAQFAVMDSSPSSAIYIGCDSLRRKRGEGKFVAIYSVVVIIHIDGKHGAKMFHFTETVPDYGSMKMRLLTEVDYTRRVAAEILDVSGDRHIEIHLDLNTDPKHKSNVAVKEAVGYIFGSFGFEPKLKPNAPAATCAADHIVRH